jgi:hypothetical protein
MLNLDPWSAESDLLPHPAPETEIDEIEPFQETALPATKEAIGD